ncbi:MAG: hypothetical protein H0X27_09855 [Caulobacteraceae bacterium]|nr:hypothetical protein [Caulobacteraceae bacterium]
MSKYEPLKQWLRRRPESEVPLSFAEVEALLGFALPHSARRHAPWWANEARGSHVQAGAWLGAGWRTSRVNIGGEKLVFVRVGGEPSVPEPEGGSPGASLMVDLDGLSEAGRRLIDDYASETGGDMAAAVFRAVHEAAIARRGRLIDQITANAPRVTGNSVDLIREDRDAR